MPTVEFIFEITCGHDKAQIDTKMIALLEVLKEHGFNVQSNVAVPVGKVSDDQA